MKTAPIAPLRDRDRRRRASTQGPARKYGRAAPSRRRREEQMAENFFLGLLLFGLAVCVFIPAFSAGFIWDDDQLLTANPQVQSPTGILGLWFAPATADYFPLMSSMLWLQFHLGQWLGLSFWNLDYLRSHVPESPWNG